MMLAFPLPANAGCGPRSEDLIIRFYSDREAAYAALKACDIDAMLGTVTSDLYADAIEDPNICLGAIEDSMGAYEIDINGNHTIADARDYENPLWGMQGIQIRKAFTLLLDRNFVVSTCCGGFARRVDQQIAYMHRSWRNQSCWYEDGTGYEFDPAQAAAILDADGWAQGSTPNPYYDPGFPGSAEYIRTYPIRHSKSGQDIDPLKYCIRTDDSRRLCAGNLHRDNLRKHGIPINDIHGPSSQLYPIVMDNINYHLYTGGWGFYEFRFPGVYVYGLFHSANFILGGANYVTGNDSNNQPNYPDVDYWLYEARFPDSYADSQADLKQALGLLWCEYFVNIPLFTSVSFMPWKCDLKGASPHVFYSNVYKVGGGPIVVGIITPPNELNIIYSSWDYDYAVLDRIYEWRTGVDIAPYDFSIDQPGYLKEWTTSSWVDPDDGVEKTLVTRTWRSECPDNPGVPLRFTRPVSGAQGEVLNVTQHYANLWYIKQTRSAWFYDNQKDVKTTRMIGDYTMEIYWNTPGYWNTYYGTTYLMPFNSLLMGSITTTVVDESLTVDADGWTTTSEPAYWITAADDTPGAGGTPLTVGTDLEMYLDARTSPGPHKCTIRVINPAYYSTTIEVSYLAAGDALGYTPGNVPWDQITEGHGMFYITDYTPGAGGSATLKRNPRYWMETAPLGEIDFVRKTAPDCLQIDIFDVVTAASAYGSQGGGVPDSNWFPGADLAPECCVIDIFDIVTITARYGTRFDIVPP